MSADVSKISLALGGAKKPPKPPTTNGVKRSHSALHDDDEAAGQVTVETVSHFDRSAGGAINASKPSTEHSRAEKPLVIIPRANRDWKEASQRNKRQRSEKVSDAHKALPNGEGQYVEEKKPTYGLNVFKRAQENDQDASKDGEVTQTEGEQHQDSQTEQNGDVPMQEKTDDERAVEALLGKEEKSELVLPMMTEKEAFERDYHDAPDMATLEDYERVPVEQFGAALLRGMGWKEGEGIGSQRGKKVEKAKVPERRPALLGIGAKEEAAVAQELGTWGKAAKDRKGAAQGYNPVLLRDKRTGETFTEEELEKKKQREEREKYEMEFEQREKRKERDSDRDRRKYDSDEEYYRRKEKEKRRRERDRDRDREGSRRHDSDRERHKERHHDRRR